MASAVLADFRALMLPGDRWAEIGEAFRLRTGRDEDWLDELLKDPWIPFSWYPALLDALGHIYGEDGVRHLVRRHIVDPDGASLYSGIMRSWTRSFGSQPDTMLPVIEHIWRAAVRGAGDVRVTFDDTVFAGDPSQQDPTLRSGRADSAVAMLRCTGEAGRAMLSSPAFLANMEGMVLGLIDRANPRPTIVEVERHERSDRVDLLVRWSRT